MMKRLILAALLMLLASPCWGAIAFVNSWKNRSLASSNTLVVTVATTTGDCIVVSVDYDNGSVQPTSVTDNGGNTYTEYDNVTNNHNISIWATPANGTTAATTVTAHFAATDTNNKQVFVGDYSGVQQIGLNNHNSATSTALTISITTQDANNFVVAGFFAVSNPQTLTNLTGNNRQLYAGAASQSAGALNDNTAASASSVTNALTASTSAAWGAVALELRSTSGAAAPIGVNKRQKYEQMDP